MLMTDATEETRADRRERYQTLLRTVGHQTSPAQPPGVRPHQLRTVLSAHGPLSVGAVDATIQAALDNDDLLAWRDGEGEVRVTLCCEPDLRRLLGHFNECEFSREACERVAGAIREVQG